MTVIQTTQTLKYKVYIENENERAITQNTLKHVR